MRPTFRLQHVQGWAVNITPRRLDSLPYSKIKAIRHSFSQRLLASRTAPAGPNPLPPATVFICSPTPSYVLSRQLAAGLPKFIMSSLSSNLRIYESVHDKGDGLEGGSFHVEERDCTPEVLIDEDLQGRGDVINYYGCGQSHIVGILDMNRARSTWSRCPATLQRHLITLMLKPFGLGHGRMAAKSPADDIGSWILHRTEQGLRKIIHINTHVNSVENIATASITVNISVPMQGVDPDRTCPHIRIAAMQEATQDRTEIDPYTSYWARMGLPVSEQAGNTSHYSFNSHSMYYAISAMQQAMGVESLRFVDHALALGESDPDLGANKMVDWEEYDEFVS